MVSTKIVKPLYISDGQGYKPSIEAGYGPYNSIESALSELSTLYNGNIPLWKTCLVTVSGVTEEFWWNGTSLVNKVDKGGSNIEVSPYTLSVTNGTIIIDNDTTGEIGECTYTIYKNGNPINITRINISSITKIKAIPIANTNRIRYSVQDNLTLDIGTYSIPLTITFTDQLNIVTFRTTQDIIVKNFSNGEFYELNVVPVSGTEYSEDGKLEVDIYVYKTYKGLRTLVPSTDILFANSSLNNELHLYALIPYNERHLTEWINQNNFKSSNNSSRIFEIDYTSTDICDEADDQISKIGKGISSITFFLRKGTNIVDTETLNISHKGKDGKDGEDGEDGNVEGIAEEVISSLFGMSEASIRIRPPLNGETYTWYVEGDEVNSLIKWNDLVQISVVENESLVSKYYHVKRDSNTHTSPSLTINKSNDVEWDDYFNNSEDWIEYSSTNIMDEGVIRRLTSDLINTKELIIRDNNSDIVAGMSGEKSKYTTTENITPVEETRLESLGIIRTPGENGETTYSQKNKILIWAGSKFGGDSDDEIVQSIPYSSFKVYEDGTVYAKKFKGVGICTRSMEVFNSFDEFKEYLCEDADAYYLDLLHCPNNMILNFDDGNLDKDVYISYALTNLTYSFGKKVSIIPGIQQLECLNKEITIIFANETSEGGNYKFYMLLDEHNQDENGNYPGFQLHETNGVTYGELHSRLNQAGAFVSFKISHIDLDYNYFFKDINLGTTNMFAEDLNLPTILVDGNFEKFDNVTFANNKIEIPIPSETLSAYIRLNNTCTSNNESVSPKVYFEGDNEITYTHPTSLKYNYSCPGKLVIDFSQYENILFEIEQNGSTVQLELNATNYIDYLSYCRIIPIFS